MGSGSGITISGGEVKATGGNDAAGIGGGLEGSGSDIIISGGEVTATGGDHGAGIGGGYYGHGNNIAISGDEVKATGGQLGAGIGGGAQGSGSGIIISGGEVNATGGSGSAGIGGGYKGSGNNIAFSGKVKATVQGGVGDRNYGAGAGIGDGGSFPNGNPVDGADLYQTSKLLDVSGLEAGAIIRCYKQGTGIPDSLLYEIPELPDEKVVEVKCITENSGHAEKTYKLIAGSYDFGEVQGDTCEITVKPEKYVAQYNSDIGVEHKLDPESQPGKIKLKWDNQKWKLVTPSDVPVVFFYVKCEKTPPENPAKLTSFVKSRVTAITDDMSTLLPKGVTFNTAPKVTFDANNTTANLLYSFTVTGTPGAKVVIKDTGATFINGNPGDDKITVTLPNGEGDKAEITVYGYRTFSVDDIQNGKLVNNATANVEGDDNNKKEAKAEVDAKDDRTLDNTLTVKKLVSGNAANTTEKFPFKATFTFPVPGASANPDGVTSGEKVEITFELAHGQTKTFSYTSDPELKTKIDNWMKENTAYWSLTGDAVFAMLSYKVEETNAKGYTLATSGDAEGNAEGHNTVTFTNTKNKPNDDHGGHYYPTTTPVPVIVIPPKTGDMTIWQSILHFLGIR